MWEEMIFNRCHFHLKKFYCWWIKSSKWMNNSETKVSILWLMREMFATHSLQLAVICGFYFLSALSSAISIICIRIHRWKKRISRLIVIGFSICNKEYTIVFFCDPTRDFWIIQSSFNKINDNSILNSIHRTL